ncbi:MAG: VWA domain-containing protein, partial [Chloroflexota bacterium]
MPFALENPSALLLLLILPAIYFVGRGRLSLMARWRGRAILGLRTVSMAAIILALSSPSVPLKDATMSVAFVLDGSQSISSLSQAHQAEWVQQAMSQMRASDQSAVIAFAGDAQVTNPLNSDKEYRPPARLNLQPGSNLSAALRLAAGLLPASGLRKVVLLSDGWDTAGQVEKTISSLPAGTRVDVVPISAQEGLPEVVVESVEIPARIREGDTFDVNVVVGSSHEAPAQISIAIDGQVTGGWDVQLGIGANLVTMSQKALPLGFHSVEVHLSPEGDTIRENNYAEGFVVVKPKGQLLLVQGNPEQSGQLRQLLEGSGLQVEEIPANQLPIQMPQLLKYDAVVLQDVSGPSLSLDQMKTLQSYVRDQGKGLLVIGGRSSYGLGDYSSSPMEEILPVSSEPPLSRERGDLALILVIDKSGSMDEGSDGTSKIAMAREAAIRATEVLKPEDQIGIIAFDTEPDWIVPVQKVGNNQADIQASISSIEASGGTDIYSALQSAYNAMRSVRATHKHITLVSDGQSWRGTYEALLERMKPLRITLSAVAIGQDADTDWLSNLAQLGEGRYYFTERIADIPNILYREVSVATRVAEVEGQVTPQFVSPSPILRGMSRDNMPPLDGYVATKPKDAATVVLKSERGDPLLSQWQYGLGRVAAWTSDAEGLWASAWLGQQEFQKVWDQAVRWTMPPPIDRSLQLSTKVDGQEAAIIADSVDHQGRFLDLVETNAVIENPDGSRITVSLSQVAPGRYQISVPATMPGLYRIEVSQLREGGVVATETTGFSVPGAPEFRRLGSNEALLKELAAATGGRALSEPSEAFSREGLPPAPGWEPLWPYLLGFALLLLP